MRLTKITVEKLFGQFDHSITFNPEGITIIFGRNGVGKTAVLRLLNGFFNQDFFELHTIPYKKFLLHFADESVVKVQRSVKVYGDYSTELSQQALFDKLEISDIEKVFEPRSENLEELSFRLETPFYPQKTFLFSQIVWRNTTIG